MRHLAGCCVMTCVTSAILEGGMVARYHGATYLSLERSHQTAPPTDEHAWVVLDSPGAAGAAGPVGPASPAGITGVLALRDANSLLVAVPQDDGLFTQRLALRDFYALIHSQRIGCSYINCTDDISLPQTSDWGWHPKMSSRLGLCRIVHSPGSHEVLFTDPPAIARAILLAGRD